MTVLPLLAALTSGLAAVLLLPGRRGIPSAREPSPPSADGPGWRRPWPLAVLAGGGALAVLPGPLGVAAAAGLGAWTHRAASALATAGSRRRRAEAVAGLPVLVDLVADALSAGAPVPRAVEAACAAWPGAAADRLTEARSRLALGGDPVRVWEAVAEDPTLAPLGRAMARSASSGAPVADVVARLAADLTDRARGDAEDRARTVGVRAAVPLGLCLLPAFVVLGIVPLAAGLLASFA